MTPAQHLPTYKHDFLADSRWLATESDHYIFHYFAGSEAEKDVASLVATQEAAFAKILAALNVAPPAKKIEYYLYPDEMTKTALMGDDWYAQSVYAEMRVHVLYTADIHPLGAHEDTHLLSLPWGVSIGLFQEGLAEYVVGHAWDGRSHASYVAEGYKLGLYPPLADFFEHEAWLRTDDSNPLYFYSLVGAFATYLIGAHDIEKFKDVYMNLRRDATKAENLAMFEKAYGSIGDVEVAFRMAISA